MSDFLSQFTCFVPVNECDHKILGLPTFVWAANNLSRVFRPEQIKIVSDSREILEKASEMGFAGLQTEPSLRGLSNDSMALLSWMGSICRTPFLIRHLPEMPFCSETTLRNLSQSLEVGVDGVICGYKKELEEWSYDSETRSFRPQKVQPRQVAVPGLMAFSQPKLREYGHQVLTSGAQLKWMGVPALEQMRVQDQESLELVTLLAQGLKAESSYLQGLADIQAQEKPPDLQFKLLVCDVDGVLTDGRMYWNESGNCLKVFHNKDGLAAKILKKSGVEIIFLSSGPSPDILAHRGKHLGVTHTFTDVEDKYAFLSEYLDSQSLSFSDIVYLGDEINDVKVMSRAGLSVCPADACEEVKSVSHLVLKTPGGQGCLMEFVRYAALFPQTAPSHY